MCVCGGSRWGGWLFVCIPPLLNHQKTMHSKAGINLIFWTCKLLKYEEKWIFLILKDSVQRLSLSVTIIAKYCQETHNILLWMLSFKFFSILTKTVTSISIIKILLTFGTRASMISGVAISILSVNCEQDTDVLQLSWSDYLMHKLSFCIYLCSNVIRWELLAWRSEWLKCKTRSY